MPFFPLTQFGPEYHSVEFETVSSMLSTYYSSRDTLNRIRQNLLTFAGSFRLPLKETERSMPFRQNR